MASSKAFLALVRSTRALTEGESVPQRPVLGELKRRLQRRQDARELDPPPSFGAYPRRLDMSELEGLLQSAREGLESAEHSGDLREQSKLRRELVALDREALEIERERAELTPSWWVRLLRWFASKV